VAQNTESTKRRR